MFAYGMLLWRKLDDFSRRKHAFTSLFKLSLLAELRFSKTEGRTEILPKKEYTHTHKGICMTWIHEVDVRIHREIFSKNIPLL